MFSLRNNRIFKKIFRLLFVGITFTTIIFAFVGISLQKEAIIELLHSEAKSLAQSITFVSSNALITDDNSYLVEFNNEYIKNNDKIKNVIIAKTDSSYFNIKKDSWTFDKSINEEFSFMQQDEEVYKIIYSPILKEEVFHYTYPIYFSGISWGWIHLSFDLSEYNQKIDSMYKQFFFLLMGFMLLSYVISYYIAKVFADPIIDLNERVSSITLDNLNVKVEDIRDDEIGELSMAFNKMTKHLDESQKKLKLSNENLEKRVQQRTSQLEKAYKDLRGKSYELEELNINLDNKVKQEIDKRRKQEQMLLHQSRLAAMGEMVGNIAHQWRQPLNALSIIIQNIDLSYRMNKLSDEFMKKSVDESLDLTTMMSKTIDDFRNFFIPNKKKEEFYLSKSLNSSLELIGSTFKNYNIVVHKNIEEGLKAEGFPNEFAQALLNVLSNAKDALIEKQIQKPEVYVSLEKKDNVGKISISDNAGGIDKEVLPKVFDPYFTTKEQGKGTGIGLYMSKMIIEQNMSGKIYAKNVESGVEFVIEMPLETVEKIEA